MKRIVIIIILSSLAACKSKPKIVFEAQTWQPPYTLPTPEGWRVERFAIPIEFATEIPYTGVEDVRFAPGWGLNENNDYWSYAFLWYLDGSPEIVADNIQENLQAYYSGLVRRNIDRRKIPLDKVIPTKTSFKNIDPINGDVQTYHGTVEMLDYLAQKPMTLNCIVHIKKDETNDRTFVFHELSPQPRDSTIWISLDKLWADFDYRK
ncbi:MAG TPA: hypothetical protein VL728_07620 [Cyclobacteriaceae bacterium]|nr:hypothetical protein [Cyclobacteriaceae bacterium]